MISSKKPEKCDSKNLEAHPEHKSFRVEYYFSLKKYDAGEDLFAALREAWKPHGKLLLNENSDVSYRTESIPFHDNKQDNSLWLIMTPSQWAFIIAAVVLTALFIVRLLPGKRGTSVNRDDDAKRFARLLIAEIKLYETYKVERGLKTNDLLGSLVDEISAARKKFSYRFSSQAIFDDALVSVLADGDPAKLGPNFKQIVSEQLNEA